MISFVALLQLICGGGGQDISGPDGREETLSVFAPACFCDMLDAVMGAPQTKDEPA